MILQNVNIATKFSFISSPNKSIILLNIYFWFRVNFALVDWTTKQIAFRCDISFLNFLEIFSGISLSFSIPPVSPKPGVSITVIRGILPINGLISYEITSLVVESYFFELKSSCISLNLKLSSNLTPNK